MRDGRVEWDNVSILIDGLQWVGMGAVSMSVDQMFGAGMAGRSRRQREVDESRAVDALRTEAWRAIHG